MTRQSLLLVEDDQNIAGTLAAALKSSYQVDLAASGRYAIYQSCNTGYNLVVLDLNLPDMSGLTVCQLMRKRSQTTPILILTGEANVMTKIKLLDAGANDYLTKPFSLGELKARLRVLSRLSAQSLDKTNKTLAVSGLVLDRGNQMVQREGFEIKLRRKEFALLECLMEHAGSAVSRVTLSRSAWQGEDRSWTNTIDVHIKYLRDKIDRPFSDSLIQTVHGTGYKLEAPAYKPNETTK